VRQSIAEHDATVAADARRSAKKVAEQEAAANAYGALRASIDGA